MSVRQILIQIGISVISLLIVAAVLWAVPKISSLFSVVFVPKGAIVAFTEESCPEGWEEYDKAEGRFLRGVSEPDKIEEVGGSDTTTLGLDNLPRHRHGVPMALYSTPLHAHEKSRRYKYYSDSEDPKNQTFTGYQGKGNPTPLSVLPQYVAVLYCQRG